MVDCKFFKKQNYDVPPFFSTQVYNISEWQIFGEEDLFFKKPRSYSVRCSSKEGKLWILDKRVIFPHLPQEFELKVLQDQNSLQYLILTCEPRLKDYNKKLQHVLKVSAQ